MRAGTGRIELAPIQRAEEWNFGSRYEIIQRNDLAVSLAGIEKRRQQLAMRDARVRVAFTMRDESLTLYRATNFGGAKVSAEMMNLTGWEGEQHRHADDARRNLQHCLQRIEPR